MRSMLSSLWRGYPFQILSFAILPLSLLIIIVVAGSFVLHQQAMLDMVRNLDARTVAVASERLDDELRLRAAYLQSIITTELDSADGIVPGFDEQFDLGWIVYHGSGATDISLENSIDWSSSDIQLWLATSFPIMEKAVISPVFIHEKGPPFVIIAAQAGEMSVLGAFDPLTPSFGRVLETNMVPDKGSPVLVVQSDEADSIFLGWRAGRLISFSENDQIEWEATLKEPAGEYIVSQQFIESANWSIIYGEPWQAVNDPLLEATEYTPLLFIPILLTALASIWLGMKRIVLPIRQLAKQATAAGLGDLEALNNAVDGIAEIQLLQSELGAMARQLNDAQHSLRDYADAVTVGQEEERKRLSREIHDSTIQSLIALNQRIQLLQLSLRGHANPEQVEALEYMATDIIADLRRLTKALRPIYLEELGLVASLRTLVSETNKASPIQVKCIIDGIETRLPAREEMVLFRVAQEALQNSVKHADATEAMIHLTFKMNEINLKVADNGQGFVMPRRPMTFTQQKHFGIVGMFERAEIIGADMDIRSDIEGGTIVELTIRQLIAK